ncbi:hypothetical protein LZ30DRAFT_284674 [Colletotrichum cereale]|nr:hypothetical protein LZ30DRAFT_284674 [Colletotrichum cereale]
MKWSSVIWQVLTGLPGSLLVPDPRENTLGLLTGHRWRAVFCGCSHLVTLVSSTIHHPNIFGVTSKCRFSPSDQVARSGWLWFHNVPNYGASPDLHLWSVSGMPKILRACARISSPRKEYIRSGATVALV